MSTHMSLLRATNDVHERLHAHPLLAPLTHSDISLTQYQQALNGFYGFYNALNNYFISTGIQCPKSVSNALYDLKRDRHVFHYDFNDSTPCKIQTDLSDSNAIWGMLYVIEGSHLGGLFIAKNIKKAFNIIDTNGCQFFTGHGRKTAKKWKKFLADLEDNVTNKKICIEAAVSIFEDLENHLWFCHTRYIQSLNHVPHGQNSQLYKKYLSHEKTIITTI